MESFAHINMQWQECLRRHATQPLTGEHGTYQPIGNKSLALLEFLWARRPISSLPDLGAMLAAGKDVRVFGDPHFGHANIIRLCERPFGDVETMDAAIWAAVEAAYRQADLVVCLGDLAIQNPIGWQRRISRDFVGKQLTIVGNHDAKGGKAEQWLTAGAIGSLAFSLSPDTLHHWALQREPDLAALLDWSALPAQIHVGLSHWPIPHDRLPGLNWINLHGHIHNRHSGGRRVNCSLEAIGYAPARIDERISVTVVDALFGTPVDTPVEMGEL